MKSKNSAKLHAIVIGIVSAAVILLFFGAITALIPTGFFTRMFPAAMIDYLLLILTSVLVSAFIGLHVYEKSYRTSKESYVAAGGSAAGFFAVSCPLCNMLLVFLLGTGTVFAYVEPARPAIGAIGIVILALLLFIKTRRIGCRTCNKK